MNIPLSTIHCGTAALREQSFNSLHFLLIDYGTAALREQWFRAVCLPSYDCCHEGPIVAETIARCPPIKRILRRLQDTCDVCDIFSGLQLMMWLWWIILTILSAVRTFQIQSIRSTFSGIHWLCNYKLSLAFTGSAIINSSEIPGEVSRENMISSHVKINVLL